MSCELCIKGCIYLNLGAGMKQMNCCAVIFKTFEFNDSVLSFSQDCISRMYESTEKKRVHHGQKSKQDLQYICKLHALTFRS